MASPYNPDPFGLTEAQAVALCGLELATFRRLVKSGALPKPLPIGGHRKVYDYVELRTAFGKLSGRGTRVEAAIHALDLELGCHDA